MPVELRRPAHRLAGVVDDEVEPGMGREELPAERLDAGRMAQVEPENLETIAPCAEIRPPRIARGRIAREPRGDDELRARAQQLEAGLVADLHPPAGQE